MAKPKSEQQSASTPEQNGGGDAQGSAVGAASAPEGAPTGTGAGSDSPAPGTASPDGAGGNQVGDDLAAAALDSAASYGGVSFMDRAVSAHYYDGEGAFLGVVTRARRGEDAMTPADLVVALGLDPAEVMALNLDTNTIVTRDGQKHRLA